MEIIGKFVSGLVLFLIGVCINSFVLVKLWNWIITPLFGLDELVMGTAFALIVITAFFKPVNLNEDKEGLELLEKLLKRVSFVIMKAIIFLGMGWLATNFI
jgi:3-methyladenine DNA glycosylase AlkD